jgi:hypothetical protein
VAARDKKDVRFRGTVVGPGDVKWIFDDKNEFPAAHADKDAPGSNSFGGYDSHLFLDYVTNV